MSIRYSEHYECVVYSGNVFPDYIPFVSTSMLVTMLQDEIYYVVFMDDLYATVHIFDESYHLLSDENQEDMTPFQPLKNEVLADLTPLKRAILTSISSPRLDKFFSSPLYERMALMEDEEFISISEVLENTAFLISDLLYRYETKKNQQLQESQSPVKKTA